MGKIVSICNQKGGVGKTTTAVNLSSFLAQKGLKILLVDMDPQTNATSGIGIDKTLSGKEIYHVISDQASAKEAIIPTRIKGLDIIPSNIELAGARMELVSAIGREYRLRTALYTIKDNYDFIFIDCPPSLGILTVNALVAAESALIPLQCEYYAMEGVSQLLHTIELVRNNLNNELKIEGVLLTMADCRTKLTNEVIGEAKNFFKEKIYDSIIPRSVKLSEAPGYGQPIMEYDKSSQGAITYSALAEEFICRNSFNNKRLEKIEVAEKPPAVQANEQTVQTNEQTKNASFEDSYTKDVPPDDSGASEQQAEQKGDFAKES